MNKPVILKYFAYAHLPARLQEISRPFGELAELVVAQTESSTEQSACLRKLLEAKDAAVRALLSSDS